MKDRDGDGLGGSFRWVRFSPERFGKVLATEDRKDGQVIKAAGISRVKKWI